MLQCRGHVREGGAAEVKGKVSMQVGTVLLIFWLTPFAEVGADFFVPPMCRETINVSRFYVGSCDTYPPEEYLSVRYGANRFNVTPSSSDLVGGFLAYGCNSTDNGTCAVLQKGILRLREYSINTITLDAGTECVFFGCYKKGTSGPYYQFKPVTITVPLLSTSTAAQSATTQHPVMASVSGLSSVVTSIGPTRVSDDTAISASPILQNGTNYEVQGYHILAPVAVLSMGLVMLLVILGGMVIAIRYRKKYQDELHTFEWTDKDCTSVNISFPPPIFGSSLTVVDSLEKLPHPKPVLSDSPQFDDVVKPFDNTLKIHSYMKSNDLNAIRTSIGETTHSQVMLEAILDLTNDLLTSPQHSQK